MLDGTANCSNSVLAMQGIFLKRSNQTLALCREMAALFSDTGWCRNIFSPEFTENLFV